MAGSSSPDVAMKDGVRRLDVFMQMRYILIQVAAVEAHLSPKPKPVATSPSP